MNDSSSRPSFGEWLSEPQTLIGLSAVLLSLCGLFISLYETSLMRKEQRASVWPYVEVGVSLNQQSVRVSAVNNGVGPARVEAAAVTYDGTVLHDWRGLVSRLMQDSLGRVPESPQYGAYHSLIGGRVLPVESEAEVLFSIGRRDSTNTLTDDERVILNQFYRATLDGRLDVKVCYCSVYDECWTTRMQDIVQRTRGEAKAQSSIPQASCDAAPQSGI